MQPPNSVASGFAKRLVTHAVTTSTDVITPSVKANVEVPTGAASCDVSPTVQRTALAPSDDVETDRGNAEGSEETKGVHVPEQPDVALTDDDHSNRDGDGSKDRPVRCVPPAVAMLEDLREKAQLRERQKHVIAADDRGIAREDQEETSTRRDLSLEQGARGVTAKRGDELIGVDVVCIEQSCRPQREQRTR